jgi:hypothetical protein
MNAGVAGDVGGVGRASVVFLMFACILIILERKHCKLREFVFEEQPVTLKGQNGTAEPGRRRCLGA